MALHSITHRSYVDYWRALNESMWHQEIVQQRLQLSTFAKVPSNEIRGMRAPFLQAGGDSMFKALHSSNGIFWDCSRPSATFLWPYTNQYASNQDCKIPPCPQGSYPLWTVPMIEIIGGHDLGCAMIDSCTPLPKTSKETFKMLHTNFMNHYEGNRAPFGIFIHSAWLNSLVSPEVEIAGRRNGYDQFLDYLATLKDVYIVSISRAIEWIKTPVTVDKLHEFTPFKVEVVPSKCSKNTQCVYKTTGGERYFTSCASECPKNYPWVGNPLGN